MWSLCLALQWLSWVKIFPIQVLLNQPVLLSPATVRFSFFLLFLFLFFFDGVCQRLTFTSVADGVVEASSIPACLRQAVGQEDCASLIYGRIFRYVHCSYIGLDFPRSAGSFGEGPGACPQPGNAPPHAGVGLLRHPAALPRGAG